MLLENRKTRYYPSPILRRRAIGSTPIITPNAPWSPSLTHPHHTHPFNAAKLPAAQSTIMLYTEHQDLVPYMSIHPSNPPSFTHLFALIHVTPHRSKHVVYVLSGCCGMLALFLGISTQTPQLWRSFRGLMRVWREMVGCFWRSHCRK